jgi:hypothetical protein
MWPVAACRPILRQLWARWCGALPPPRSYATATAKLSTAGTSLRHAIAGVGSGRRSELVCRPKQLRDGPEAGRSVSCGYESKAVASKRDDRAVEDGDPHDWPPARPVGPDDVLARSFRLTGATRS